MNDITRQHLKMLEMKNRKNAPIAHRRLKVFYGFSKINKIQKREAIAIVFENQEGAGWENSRSGKSLRKVMNIVTEREQTPGEAAEASNSNRVFTQWLIFLDDKKIAGSLENALAENMEADKKNVSPQELMRIKEELKQHFLITHPDYREPNRELSLEFGGG